MKNLVLSLLAVLLFSTLFYIVTHRHMDFQVNVWTPNEAIKGL